MLARCLMLGVAAFALVGVAAAFDDGASPDAPPPEFAPFEHLIGGWKGRAIQPKNPLKGTEEKQMWAWKFAKGKPVGMTLESGAGKFLAKAQLTGDAKTREYRLEGTDPEGKKIAFAGKLDDANILHMERLNPPAAVGKERLDIALNQNKIRYTMRLFRQEPDAPQYASVMEAGMTKEGESFAAGGAAGNVEKCIITGGAGTIAVSYQGKSYPVCCSGCRDEFNENPEKYVKKYLAKLEKGEVPPPAATDKAPAAAKAMPKGEAPTDSKAKGKASATKAEPKPAAEKDKVADPAAKAASLLSQATALEKAGKAQAALTYYKRVAKEFPDTPSARKANDRIKALGK